MREIGDQSPYDEPDKNDLIEDGLVKKSYKISISSLELGEESIIVSAYCRTLVYLSKLIYIGDDRKYK
jgi:hypothetical protein